MSDLLLLTLLAGSTLVLGVVAGVFFTFSDFIMRSFAAASDDAGTEAMQQINRVIYRSGFMVLLLGMVPWTALLSGLSAFTLPVEIARNVYTGTALYWLGMFAITVFGNVPMNNRLDALPLTTGAAQTYWQTYRINWTKLNHLRTAATVVATVCFGWATLQLAMML